MEQTNRQTRSKSHYVTDYADLANQKQMSFGHIALCAENRALCITGQDLAHASQKTIESLPPISLTSISRMLRKSR